MVKMFIGVEFNRQFDKQNDYASVGGFEFKDKNGNICKFDFQSSYGYISDNTVEFALVDFDDDYHEGCELTKEFIEGVDEIIECYVYYEGENLEFKKIDYISFNFNNDIYDVSIDSKIINNKKAR